MQLLTQFKEQSLLEAMLVCLQSLFIAINLDEGGIAILFDDIRKSKPNREHYIIKRKEYLSIISSSKENVVFEDETLFSLIEEQNKAFKLFWSGILDNDNNKNLTNSRENILRSMTHMFFNRIYGEKNSEALILNILGNANFDLYSRKKSANYIEG